MEMLRTFLFEIAGCASNFTVQNRQQTCISEIREKVGKSKVLVRAGFSSLECILMGEGGNGVFSEDEASERLMQPEPSERESVGKSIQLNSPNESFFI